MNKCLAFALIATIVISGTMAAPRSGDFKAACKPWLGLCQLTEQCCRDLLCLPYAAKCVPGKIYPDNRPIGDGPFPPTPRMFDFDVDDNVLEAENDSD